MQRLIIAVLAVLVWLMAVQATAQGVVTIPGRAGPMTTYASFGVLPPAGTSGRLANVAGVLYLDNGSAWVIVGAGVADGGGWTDAGTIVQLTTPTDLITIGSIPSITGALNFSYGNSIKYRNSTNTGDTYALSVSTFDGVPTLQLGDSGTPDVIPGSGGSTGSLGRPAVRWNTMYANNIYVGATNIPVARLDANTFPALQTLQAGIAVTGDGSFSGGVAIGGIPSLSGALKLAYGESVKYRNSANNADIYAFTVGTADGQPTVQVGSSGAPDVIPGSGNIGGHLGRLAWRWGNVYAEHYYVGAAGGEVAVLTANTFSQLQTLQASLAVTGTGSFTDGVKIGSIPSLTGALRLGYGESIKVRNVTNTADHYAFTVGTFDGVSTVQLGDSGAPDVVPGAGNLGGNLGRGLAKWNYVYTDHVVICGFGCDIGATIIWGLAVENFTKATVGVPVQWSPGYIQRTNAWDLDGAISDSHFFEQTSRSTSANTTKAAQYVTWLQRDADGGGAGPTTDIYALNSDGQALHASGTSPLPSLSFLAEPTLGFYRSSATVIGLAGTFANNLSIFAATTSAQLFGVLSDETGTGVSVAATAPTFTTSIATPMITSAAAADTVPYTVSGYSVTGSGTSGLISLAGTWNTSGTPTVIKMNLTDTASNAASLFLDFQVSSTSKFKISKTGILTTTAAASFGGIVDASSTFRTAATGEFEFNGRTRLQSTTNGRLGAINSAGTSGIRFQFFAEPTWNSGFGTSYDISGTSSAGRIDVGTGGVAATGVLNFLTTWANIPSCTANNETTTLLVRATPTTTTLTLTSAVPWTANDKLSWTCTEGF